MVFWGCLLAHSNSGWRGKWNWEILKNLRQSSGRLGEFIPVFLWRNAVLLKISLVDCLIELFWLFLFAFWACLFLRAHQHGVVLWRSHCTVDCFKGLWTEWINESTLESPVWRTVDTVQQSPVFWPKFQRSGFSRWFLFMLFLLYYSIRAI